MSTAGEPGGLAEFAAWLRARGYRRVTVRHRVIVVRAFLADVPDFLTAADEDVESWLERQGLSRSSRSTYRTHVRSLYRWAAEVGHRGGERLRLLGGPGSATSPTPYGRGRVLMAVSTGWVEPITAWVNWLAAASYPPGTLYLREYQLRRFAGERADRGPQAVSGDELAEWMSSRDWSPETRRAFRSALRSFFGWAHSTGRLGHNPAALLAPVRRPVSAARPTPEDVLRAAVAGADERVRLMVLLASRAGLRRAEIAQVHRQDVVAGASGASLLVRGKGRRQRLVPLSAEVARALVALPDGWAFPGQVHGHLSPAHVGKLVSRALGAGWTTHTLRHRFATVAYAGQRDLFAVQALLGHSSPETTQVYVRLPDDAMRAAVEAAR